MSRGQLLSFSWAEQQRAATWRSVARLRPTLQVRQQARQVVAGVRLLELGEDLPHYVILKQRNKFSLTRYVTLHHANKILSAMCLTTTKIRSDYDTTAN